MFERGIGHVEMDAFYHLLGGDYGVKALVVHHGGIVANTFYCGFVADGKLIGETVDECIFAYVAEFGASFLLVF